MEKKRKKIVERKNKEEKREIGEEKKAEKIENVNGEIKKAEEDNPEKQNKQLKWILWIMGVILIFFLIGFWISEETRKFTYIGLSFEKDKFGNIPIYTTSISGFNAKNMPMNFKLALRQDPRQSKVPVSGQIKFLKDRERYFVFNMTEENKCDDGYVLVGLGMLMANLGLELETGVMPQKAAIEQNKTYVDCSNKKANSVFILTPGNQTRIYQTKENGNCYILETKNCETLEVIERFEIATLAMLNDEELPAEKENK